MAANKVPVTVTRVRSVDIAPNQEVVVPIKPLTPGDLRELHLSLKHIEGRLATQSSRLRTKIRECPATLAEQEAACQTFLLQSEPGFEVAQLVSHAAGMWQAYKEFTEAVREAQRIHTQARETMSRVKTELARLQEVDVIALEHREQMTRALGPVSYVTVSLGILLDEVRALGEVGRASVARLIHATGMVGRRWQVERLTTRLRHLQQVTQTVRAPDPHDARLEALVQEVAESLQMSMAVPQIEWPPKDQPFAPPRLIQG